MSTPQALQNFADWVATIRGEEASEAQTYVNRLLQAWGWADSVEAGVIFERKIPGGSIGGGLGKADALIEGLVLIEMKSRGQLLQPSFAQLDRYNQRLIPKPSYCILCNFDEIWIYDFLSERGDALEPVDKLHVADLPRRYLPLAFLSKERQTPQFGVNRFEVTEAQARRMGELFCLLKARGGQSGDFNALDAQRFVLQCVLTMFAEDRGMLPDGLFNRVLQDCRINPQGSYDLIAGLFEAMNTQGLTSGGRFKGTPYFNGGLFSHIPRIELEKAEVEILAESALDDWSQVQPSIFGNIFESSIDPKTRHARGQHFTSEQDILKVIRPTIIDPWEKRIFSATIGGTKDGSTEKLEALQEELAQFIVCDPACGSGNFLYMAYNAVKNLEALILQRINERRRSKSKKAQTSLRLVTPFQFFGMDISPFAVELARVTLMIARKVANDRLGLTERDLPLDNLDNNIRVADALFTPWPKADAYVGNPPFVAVKNKRLELGDEYVEELFAAYPGHRDTDFCSPWFTIAHNNLGPGGRAGLVATNSICQGKNRRATLDFICANDGHISNAISSQPWSGEANVFVSIVNWSKEKPDSYILDGQVVKIINSSLMAEVDASRSAVVKANKGYSFVGVQPNSKNFYVSPEVGQQWIRENPAYSDVVRPFTTADDLTDIPLGEAARWIIDFSDMPMEEAERYPHAFAQAKALVKPERANNREQVLREKWWRFKRTNSDLRQALSPLESFICFPRHSKWVIPLAIAIRALPGDSTTVIASCDSYAMGILTSSVHRRWILAQKSTIKGDTRYTHTTCFNSFPFPQIVAPGLAQQIRQAMTALNDYRNEVMVARNWGITDLYNAYFHEPASQLAKLHQGLDALVLKAYGWKASEDILSNLLDLNLELAEREKAGEKVVGPWAPS